LGVAAMLRLQPLQLFLSFFARHLNAPSGDSGARKKRIFPAATNAKYRIQRSLAVCSSTHSLSMLKIFFSQ